MKPITAREREVLEGLRGTAPLSEIARKTGLTISKVAACYGMHVRSWHSRKDDNG